MDALRRVYDYLDQTTVLGIGLGQLALACLIVLLAVALRRVFSTVVVAWLRRLAARTGSKLDDALLTALDGPIGLAFLIAGLFGAVVVLNLPVEPTNVRRFFYSILKALVAIDGTWFAFRFIDALAEFLAESARRTDSRLDDQLIPLFRKAAKIFMSVLAVIFVIQNLGYSVASLVAGLGIGGLALALAAQQTLSNLFGSITILVDRPFAVGDWIEGTDFEGIVEEIGLRSTRIRTFAKTQVSIPNAVLANAIVNNWSRMPVRRFKMTIGVTYGTTASQLEAAVEGIRRILREHPGVQPDSSLVNFTEFGSSSLDIFVYYFTNTTVWADSLAVRQDINLKIMRLLESLGVRVALPARTVYLKPAEAEGGSAEPPRAPGSGGRLGMEPSAHERRVT
jgi:MscS family membrane protein